MSVKTKTIIKVIIKPLLILLCIVYYYLLFISFYRVYAEGNTFFGSIANMFFSCPFNIVIYKMFFERLLNGDIFFSFTIGIPMCLPMLKIIWLLFRKGWGTAFSLAIREANTDLVNVRTGEVVKNFASHGFVIVLFVFAVKVFVVAAVISLMPIILPLTWIWNVIQLIGLSRNKSYT